MQDWIKPDRIVFKIGSFEWLNYFGLPAGIIVLGIMQLCFFLIELNVTKNEIFLIGFVLTSPLGLITYYLQFRRLRFKTFKLNRDINSFKSEINTILLSDGWEIDYDNKLYLQATYRGSIFNLDMLTLRFRKSEIQWNVIHHPYSQNSIAALLTLNRQGNRIIKKIKASAYQE